MESKYSTLTIIIAFMLLLAGSVFAGVGSTFLYDKPKETEMISDDESNISVDESSASVDVSSNQIIRTEEREADIKPMKVIATAYCSCAQCCGIWAENRENGIVYTASGAIAQAGHTIAVDTSVIPFGSVVLIGGVAYVAEDTGSAIIGNRIDIYFDSHDEALQFGIQELTVYVKP